MKSFFHPKNSRSGYALAVTLVFVAVSLTIAGGLALSRQMWGQMGEKQLHRVLTQTVLDVDSLAMIASLRNDFSDGTLIVSESDQAFNNRTSLSITPRVGDPTSVVSYGVSDPQLGLPLAYESTGEFPLNANSNTGIFYEDIVGTRLQTTLGAWDPYRGIWSVSEGFGVMTTKGLSGDARDDKSLQTVRDANGKWVSGSRLKAWSEVDTAKIHEVAVRRFPISAFTLFVPAIPYFPEQVTLDHRAYATAPDNYSIGRYYLDTSVAPGRAGIKLTYPMVVTRGFAWADPLWNSNNFYWDLDIPAISSGGGGEWSSAGTTTLALQDADPTEFYKNRYVKYGGMFATGEDRPVKLVRYGGSSALLQGSPSWLPPDRLAVGGFSMVSVSNSNLLAQLWNRGGVQVWRTGPNTGRAVIAFTDTNFGPLSGKVTVNDTTKEITLNLVGVNIGASSLLLNVCAGGVDALGNPLSAAERQSYKVRVICPNAYDLGLSVSDTGVGGLTIASPHPIVLRSGFNGTQPAAGVTPVPVMVVAQNLAVSGGSAGFSFLEGVFVTTGAAFGANLTPLYNVIQVDPAAPSSYLFVKGSIILWSRAGNRPLISGYSTVDTYLRPNLYFTQGKSYAPGTPSVWDLRFAREQLRSYRMYSEDTTFTPSN